MSNKRKIIFPTPEEAAAITAAALSDPDAHHSLMRNWRTCTLQAAALWEQRFCWN